MYQNSFEYFHKNRALTFERINFIFRIVLRHVIFENDLLDIKNLNEFIFHAINETFRDGKSIEIFNCLIWN